MNCKVPIVGNVYWIGANDRETALFENYWPLDKGVSYNSYLINDEKVALVDTVKFNKTSQYMEKIRDVIGDKKIDYIIINHMEPDHSGSLKELIHQYPDIKIVGNKKTFQFVKGFYDIVDNYYEINDGDVLDLGHHKIKFYTTPMVHWPETMMSYDMTEKVLFSGDAFGGFGALDGGIFDDEVNIDFYESEIRRYYTNIVGKYSPMVQKALKKLSGVEIGYVCATHGPIWRENPENIIKTYDDLSSYKSEEGVVIVYGTMYGNTAKMADYLSRIISEAGIKEVKVYDASKTHVSYIISDIWKYKGLVLGSCAYNTGVFPSMDSVLKKLEVINLKDRYLGIFGCCSWSGGGVKGINAFAEKTNWELVEEPVEAVCTPKTEEFEKLDKIGREIARKVKESFK
ncbi:MAG: FprA family A-type flavoprotein [Firmicutes bacterium]|jgi:flavorubredoxin|nr:FprA family A-type flavoprotein [Bacillota bacterium]